MKLKVFSASVVTLLTLSAVGVAFLSVSKETLYEAEAYSVNTVPTTIDLNPTTDSNIREYYADLLEYSDNEKTGTNLLKNLKTILKNGQKYFSYGERATKAVWQAYEITDRDWEKSPASAIPGYDANKNIITNYVYGTSNTSVGSNPYLHTLYVNRDADNQTRAWGDHSQTNYGINQEHVWAKARGFDDKSKAVGARGDLMHLWSGNGNVNGHYHSNYYFGNVDKKRTYYNAGSDNSYLNGNLKGYSSRFGGNTTVFEPQDSDKGDIARTIFYMAARYNYLSGSDSDGIDASNPNLEIVDNVSSWASSGYTSSTSVTGKMGVLSDLLEWNRLDPPDEWEIHRNDLLYTNFTNNRNPFIDFPDWAEYIWGDKAGNKYANPNNDTIHSFSTGGEEPPQNIPVTGISLISSASVKVDESTVLVPDITPHNATNKNVTWYTDNANIATVDNGRVTGVSTGTVDITAVTVDGQLEATCEVTVEAPDVVNVTSVELEETSIQLDLNGDQFTTISALVLPENASNQNVTWSSSNENVVTVDNGDIAAVKVGEATITVTTEDGGKTATCNIKVIDSTPTETDEITINRSILEIATENNWSNSVAFATSENTAVNLDENISFYTKGTGNNGKYYTNGQNWRLYFSGDGNIVIKSEDGYTIKNVTLNYSVNNGGYLVDSESHTIESGQAYDVNDASVTYEVAGPSNAQVRINNISVTYESKEQTPTIELSSIAVADYESSFTTGDTFVFGGTVTATYSDSSTKNVTESASFSGYDMSKAGTQTVTVSYTEDEITKTTNYEITVNEPAPIVTLESIAITTKPNKLTYKMGEDLDLTGMVVTATYSDKTTAPITDYTVSGYDKYKADTQTITVTYQELTATFTVTVNKTLSSISVSNQTSTFEKGDEFSFGGTVTAIYSDGSSKDVTFSTTFSGYDMSKAGTQTVTVSYTEDEVTKTTTYQITVNEPKPVVTLTSIEVTTNPTKLEYVTGEDLDLTGMVVTATFSDKTTTPITDYTVSGYDKYKAGTQTITVTYQGLTATFSVNVIDGLKDQKDAAIKSLNEYYNSIDLSKYSLDNLMKLLSGLRAGESAIRAAKSVEEINAALADAKAYLASIPQEESPTPPVTPETKTNTCGGDIFATSAILSIIALLGAALITYKKHK